MKIPGTKNYRADVNKLTHNQLQAKRINVSPKTYHSQLKLPEGCEIVYERSEANKAHVSSKIYWGLSINVLCNGKSKALYPYEYTIKDGRV